MTTIHTTTDLVRALREQPDLMDTVRALVLTDELLNLPGRVDRLEEALRRLTERVDTLTEAVHRLNERMDTLASALESMLQAFNEYVERTDRRLARLESDMAEVKSDVGDLKTDMGEVKTRMGTLTGHYLEQRVITNILNVIKDDLDLTRGRVLRSGSGDMNPQLRDAIENAEERGLITEDEVSNLLVADIIIRARRGSDRQYVYGVIEVSRTIHDRDIDRARDRADTLAKVTGEESIAAVIGGIIHPSQQTVAERRNVQAVIPTLFEEE